VTPIESTASSLHHTAPHCTTLHHTAIHCNTLHHTATHCTTLQHTAPHCNTLHHTATHRNTPQHTAPYCNTLLHTATHNDSESIHSIFTTNSHYFYFASPDLVRFFLLHLQSIFTPSLSHFTSPSRYASVGVLLLLLLADAMRVVQNWRGIWSCAFPQISLAHFQLLLEGEYGAKVTSVCVCVCDRVYEYKYM